MEFVVEAPWVEDISIVAMGLDWHWDLSTAGLDAGQYGQMLGRVLCPSGFRVVGTSEPNIAMHASNRLFVRVGANVTAAHQAVLDEALFIAPWQRVAT